jgi:hypothetical protein
LLIVNVASPAADLFSFQILTFIQCRINDVTCLPAGRPDRGPSRGSSLVTVVCVRVTTRTEITARPQSRANLLLNSTRENLGVKRNFGLVKRVRGSCRETMASGRIKGSGVFSRFNRPLILLIFPTPRSDGCSRQERERVRSSIEALQPLHSQARLPSEKFKGVFSRNPQHGLGALSISPRPLKADATD